MAVERFWSLQGWSRRPVDIVWRFDSVDDFESVVRIEFAPELADVIVREHASLEVDYAVNLWFHSYRGHRSRTVGR